MSNWTLLGDKEDEVEACEELEISFTSCIFSTETGSSEGSAIDR